MATSGQILTTVYGDMPAFLKVKWNQVSQSIPNNSTTIKVEVYGCMMDSFARTIKFGPMQIKVNGKTEIKTTSTISKAFSGEVLLQEKTVEIPHNYDGTKTFSLSAQTSIESVNTEASNNFTLAPITTASTITANSCTIGDTVNIVINSKDSRFAHSIDWEILDGRGIGATLATKTKESLVRWKVPLNFTQYMGSKSSIEVVITCSTYLYNEFVGTRSKNIIIKKAQTSDGPIITAKWKEANSTVAYLTGTNNNIVPGYSNIDVIDTTAKSRDSSASVEAIYVKNNGWLLQIGPTNHMINKITDPVLRFSARDTKGRASEEIVKLNKIPYTKPTCSVEVVPNANNLEVRAKGTYFKGSFGARNNNLVMYWEYSVDDGAWQREERLYPDIDSNGSWSATRTIPNPNYKSSYKVRIHLWDALEDFYVYSKKSAAKTVFDWSESDFNFNVPVYIMGKEVKPGESTPPPTPTPTPTPKPMKKQIFGLGAIPTVSQAGSKGECVVLPELGLGFIRCYFKNANKITKGSVVRFAGLPPGYRPGYRTALAYQGLPDASMFIETNGDISLSARADFNAGYALYCSGFFRFGDESDYEHIYGVNIDDVE